MAKTEVILTHNIVGLGGESDQVRVAAGYARNFLFPQGFAVPLNSSNKRRIEALKQRRAEREAHEFNAMTELSKGVAKLVCVVKVKAGDDGKMFGSVTAGMVADELKHQFDITLDKRKIHLEHPIKTLGEHTIELHLHAEVKGALKVRVESLTPVTAPAPAEAKSEERKDFRTEKRGKRVEGEKTEKTEKAEKVQAVGEKKPRAAAKSEKPAKAPKAEKKAKSE